jgi:hypothetical protein
MAPLAAVCLELRQDARGALVLQLDARFEGETGAARFDEAMRSGWLTLCADRRFQLLTHGLGELESEVRGAGVTASLGLGRPAAAFAVVCQVAVLAVPYLLVAEVAPPAVVVAPVAPPPLPPAPTPPEPRREERR